MVTTQIIYKMASLTVNEWRWVRSPQLFFFFKTIVSTVRVWFLKVLFMEDCKRVVFIFSPKKKKILWGCVCYGWMRESRLPYYTITTHTATLLAAYGPFCFFWLVKLMFWLDLLGSLALLDFELLFLICIGKNMWTADAFPFHIVLLSGFGFCSNCSCLVNSPCLCCTSTSTNILENFVISVQFLKIKCLNISLSIWSTTNTRE